MTTPDRDLDRIYDLLIECGDRHLWSAEFHTADGEPELSTAEANRATLAYRQAEELIRAHYGLPRPNPIPTMVTVTHASGRVGWIARVQRWLSGK